MEKEMDRLLKHCLFCGEQMEIVRDVDELEFRAKDKK